MTREYLPPRRRSDTQKVVVNGRSVFVGFGYYPDGRLGEIFISTAKDGTELQGVAHAFAMLASLALQYGCPPSELADALRGYPATEIPHHVGKLLEEFRTPPSGEMDGRKG